MSLKLTVKSHSDGSQGPTLGSLPGVVAQAEGLYAQEGLEVGFAVQNDAWKNAPPVVLDDIEQVNSFNRHFLFEEGQSEVFGGCEWGQVRRAYDSSRGGKVIGRNDGAQWHAIITAGDSQFTHTRQLFNQPVAVRFHSGSHYATLEMLEGFVKRDEIHVVNMEHADAYRKVVSGELAGVTLPEPWITLALKQGHRVLVETREYSAEVGAPELDPDAYAAYNRARRRAAQLINADKQKYFTRYFASIIGSLPEEYRSQLEPADFDLRRLHWIGPTAYLPEEFQRTYDWMVSWGLIGGDATYESIVNREFATVG